VTDIREELMPRFTSLLRLSALAAFVALVSALSAYTATYIAEAVRAAGDAQAPA